MALHLLHVPALDPDELGGVRAVRGVQVALVVQVRHAGLQRVGAQLARLAGVPFGRGFEFLPVGHLGLARSLAVDGPGRTVVVGHASLGPLVVVGQDAEPQVGVLVDHLALRLVLLDVPGEERLVPEDLLHQRADLPASFRAGFGLEDTTAVRGELLQGVAHDATPSEGGFRGRPAARRPADWNPCTPSPATVSTRPGRRRRPGTGEARARGRRGSYSASPSAVLFNRTTAMKTLP